MVSNWTLMSDLSKAEIPAGWHGKLNLVYAHRQNTTTLIHNQNQAPLKVQRPFYPEGQEVCHSVILHTAGGVVGGDRLSCNFHLQPNAQALITTAAASKIYRSNGRYKLILVLVWSGYPKKQSSLTVQFIGKTCG
jgi:urease accessory protein